MDTVIQTGQSAPRFSLPDLVGRLHRPEETRGSILVINFWSAECPWVERADREILRLLPVWGDSVRYWAVASNVNEPIEMLQRVAVERDIPVVLHDAQHIVADRYDVKITPHFFVIDTLGILRYQGAIDDVTFRQREPQRFFLKMAVQSLLEGRLPDPVETPAYGCTIVRMA